MEINRTNLKNITLEPYQKDMDKYEEKLKPYLEHKFMELHKAAEEGKTEKRIYSVWKDMKLCCYCPGLNWKFFSEKNLDLQNYSSLKCYFPSLQLKHLFQTAKKIVRKINKEREYDFVIDSSIVNSGFWINISW